MIPLMFGLALSVASTVALSRALEERRLVDMPRGKIAVGWLIVEDLGTVLALVLLPVFAESINGADSSFSHIALTIAIMLGAFFVGMILNESELWDDAAPDSLPLRDAFAALFFVSGHAVRLQHSDA